MSTTTIAAHAPLIYTPEFFDPSKAYGDYVPDIEAAMQEGIAYGLQNGLVPAQKLMKEGVAHAAMLTDLQQDFRPGGRLPVSGTDDVVLRTCVRLLNGTVTDYYTGVTFSLDGHPIQHITFDHYFRDHKGNPLDLTERKAACLTLEDRQRKVFRAYGFGADGSPEDIGLYQPRFDPQDAVEYWDHLQATGQGDIWAFVPHCILGTDGTNLHPLLVETIAFMCGARTFQPTIVHKGHISNTDWFGPLEPCRPDADHPQGGFQKDIVDDFKRFDTLDFFGVAEDFCDFYMKKQTLTYLDGTEHIGKMRFVTDGTAPIIPDAPHVRELNQEAEENDVVFITHDAPFA